MTSQIVRPWIQHFSRSDIKNGTHYDPGNNTVLIQIKDCDEEFVKPAYRFVNTIKFEFEDTEDEKDPNSITDHDAKLIAMILRDSYAKGRNVIVHCVAGISRSAGVAVCGQQIGFLLEDKVRIPNCLVKKKIYKELGLYFDPEKTPFNLPDPYGILYEPKDYD